MAVLLTPPFLQFDDANGLPLAGGQLFTYIAGTTTPKATFTDSSGSTPAANPVILDSAGRATVWLSSSGAYKFILKDASGVTVRTTDDVTAFTTQTAATVTSILQCVYSSYSINDSTTAIIPVDNTIPQITEGKQFLSASITPKFSTSRLRITVTGQVFSASAIGITFSLFRDATANAIIAAVTGVTAGNTAINVLKVEVNAASTATIVFTVRYGPTNAATAYINGSAMGSYFGGAEGCILTIEEIAV